MRLALIFAMLLAGQSGAASSEPIYPDPAFFLPLAKRDLGFEAYVRCLAARGEHLGLGTDLSIDEVMSRTIADCKIVRDAAQETMILNGSAFRSLIEENAPRPLDDQWFAAKIPAILDDLEESWKTGFVVAAAQERSSERYDPAAYMADYYAKAASGNLPQGVGE